MENRSSIYYDLNTVIPPAPGKKRMYKTINQPVDFIFSMKTMPFEPKVCATNRCVWCNHSFSCQYRVICLNCLNCQYCGLLSTTGFSECIHCGNHLDHTITPPRTILRPNSVEE